MPDAGHYRYLVGPLGQAYAVLFGIASAEQVEAIFRNQAVQPAGVPAVRPDFTLYQQPDGNAFACHAGTVWPQIQGIWATAGAAYGDSGILGHELYHPLTGEIYGGTRERTGKGIVLWHSLPRQTWVATAVIRMIVAGVAGLTKVELRNLAHRGMTLNMTVEGAGCKPRPAKIFLPYSTIGKQDLRIVVNG